MSRVDGEIDQSTLVDQSVSVMISQEHKAVSETHNSKSSKTLSQPSKIPKPSPGSMVSKASRSEIVMEYMTPSAIPKAPGTGISNETKVLHVGSDNQGKSARKSKGILSKAATGHADRVLEEKHVDKRLVSHSKSQEISISEVNGERDFLRKSKESLAGHGHKRADTLQKCRETSISTADKRSAVLRKSREGSAKTRSPGAFPETHDSVSETQRTPRKHPNELSPNTSVYHKNGGSVSTRKSILCSECRAALQKTVCFIANDGRAVACSNGGLGHVLHCKYPWCLTNDPNHVLPSAVQPKNYLISKRNLYKAQSTPKIKGNKTTSNGKADRNEALSGQPSLVGKPLYGIKAWEDEQHCSKSDPVADQNGTECSQSTDADEPVCGFETWDDDQSCIKKNPLVWNSMTDQSGTSSSQFISREEAYCGIEASDNDQSSSKSNPMAYYCKADQDETSSSQFICRQEATCGTETWEDHQTCSDDGSQIILSGDTHSTQSEIKGNCWDSPERNGDYSMVTAAGIAEMTINDHNFFNRNGGESLEIKSNDCYIYEIGGGNGSESLETKSACGTSLKRTVDYSRTTSSELVENKVVEQNYFDSNGSESYEINNNSYNFCDSNNGTGCKSSDIESDHSTPLEGSSGIDVDFPEVQSSWQFLECNGGNMDKSREIKIDNWTSDCTDNYRSSTDSESLEMEMHYLASSAGNVESLELSDGRRSSWSNRRQRSYINAIEQQEAETVRLKKQLIQKRKQAGEYLIDNAVEEEIHKLAPHGETRVKIIVEAFERIISHNDSDLHYHQQQHSVGKHEHTTLSHTHIAMQC